jgi:UTP--glucose-1-phosphate uridylyltransferase
VNDRLIDISRIVEKPAPEDAPSRLGVAGRYILTPGVFHEIATQPRGVGGIGALRRQVLRQALAEDD